MEKALPGRRDTGRRLCHAALIAALLALVLPFLAGAQTAQEKESRAASLSVAPSPGQAAAKTNRAEAPASAEPEKGLLDMGIKGLFPQKGRGCVKREKPFENRCSFLDAFEAIYLSSQNLLRDTEGRFNGR